jgi:type IV pilus assembly protein PilX
MQARAPDMKTAMRKDMQKQNPPRRQGGAALVVGLLLLMVITLLAIAGMNSATVEYVMAGNAQYHQYAFQAAETGIQQAIAYGQFVPGAVASPPVTVAVNANDSFNVTFSSDLNGAPQTFIWGSSINKFTGYDFTITSVGTSARNAQTQHTQGIFQLAPGSP